jgi:hypothetical protein
MNANRVVTGLAAMFVLLSGCVIGGGGGGGSRGDVTFLWRFNSASCAAVPEVTQVTIAIPGQTLSNGGVYACNSGGTDGITLLDFRPGTYTYTIEGRNNGGSVLYASSGTFIVNGSVTVQPNLAPNANAPGSIYLNWTFPPSSISGGQPASCAQTSGPISNVDVSVDGAAPTALRCTDGQTNPGVLIQGLAGGTHTIKLDARDANGFYYYQKVSSFTVVAAQASQQTFTFDWYAGSLAIRWAFANSATQLTCAQAGIQRGVQLNVPTVYVNLRDSQGNYLYASPGVEVPCQTATTQGTVFPYLPPGTYQFFAQAYGTGNVLYQTSTVAPITVSVASGQFPVIDGTTQIALMTP